MVPNALVSDVPPLKTRGAVAPLGRPNRRLKVQQTQKSFSMIVSATPRPAGRRAHFESQLPSFMQAELTSAVAPRTTLVFGQC